MISEDDVKRWMNTKVTITTIRDSKYTGLLNGMRDGKVHVSGLFILNKDGTFKTTHKFKHKNKRWFNLASLKQITVYVDPPWPERTYIVPPEVV